jgi:hypothetical protein
MQRLSSWVVKVSNTITITITIIINNNNTHSFILFQFIYILGVGKTSLVVRYIQKTFSPNSTSTIGASFMTKKL